MKLLAVVVLLGFGIGPAFSAEWTLIDPGQEKGYMMFGNPESISTQGAYRKAWFRTEYEKEQHLPGDPIHGYRSSKTLVYFHCQDRTLAHVRAVVYSEPLEQGTTVGSMFKDLDSARFHAVIPETVEEGMFAFACVTAN